MSYTWSADGRLASKTDPTRTPAQTTTYTWVAGRLRSATNPALGYTFDYDANGRLKSVTDTQGRTIRHDAYDAAGRRTQATILAGGAEQNILTYAYNPSGQLTTLASSRSGTFGFGYDASGRRASLSYPNGAVTSYSYNDETGWLTGIATPALPLTLGYPAHDNTGNRTQRVEDGIVASYAYDATDQLVQAQSPGGTDSFTYDAVGNRTLGPAGSDTAYAHDAGNRMLHGRQDSYSYDPQGNPLTRSLGDGQVWQYGWDGENRLIEARLVQAGATLRTVSFTYDPFGRRIEKRAVEGTTTTTTSYFYDGEDIVLESKAVQIGAGTPVVATTQYVHGPGIDEPLALVRDGQSYFYHADGLGSIVAITDSQRNIVQRYSYDSFGVVASLNPDFENSCTYTGREWDKETGLYYYRARYYDPMEGRFISKDPIGFDGGDINLYGYVQGNPINFVDPSGLHERPQFGGHFHVPMQPHGVYAATLKNGWVLFFPSYDNAHPYVKSLIDFHELSHVNDPSATEREIYQQELRYIDLQLAFVCEDDPGRAELLKVRNYIIQYQLREMRMIPSH